MKKLIGIASFIGLFSIFQLAYAADLFTTGETLTANKLNAIVPTYAIGDIGPAGGWVFYVTDDGLHGLEAAPVDQANAAWGCQGVFFPGADSRAIGTGARNTDDIIRGCPIAGIAAAVADEYISPSGYIDWYLPSQDDLVEMYLVIGQGSTNVGGFANTSYWSSWNQNLNQAGTRDFTSGGVGTVLKQTVLGVRAVRGF